MSEEWKEKEEAKPRKGVVLGEKMKWNPSPIPHAILSS